MAAPRWSRISCYWQGSCWSRTGPTRHEQADLPDRGRLAAPARGARRRDDVLAVVGGAEPRGEAGQPDPAGGAVPDQARPHLCVGRQDAVRREPRLEEERSDAVLPALPGPRARVAGRRLLD